MLNFFNLTFLYEQQLWAKFPGICLPSLERCSSAPYVFQALHDVVVVSNKDSKSGGWEFKVLVGTFTTIHFSCL